MLPVTDKSEWSVATDAEVKAHRTLDMKVTIGQGKPLEATEVVSLYRRESRKPLALQPIVIVPKSLKHPQLLD